MSTLEPMELLRFASALVVVAGPGLLIARWLAPERDAFVRGSLGFAYGIALQLCGAMLLPNAEGPTRWLFVATCWVVGIAAILSVRRPRGGGDPDSDDESRSGVGRGRSNRGNQPRSAPGRAHTADAMLVGVLVLQAIALIAIVSTWVLPAGNDAVYHVAIADKLQSAGLWPADFLPYDPVAPNYPPASHWLCAFVSSTSGVAVHHVYSLMMATLLVALAALVGALGRAWRGPWVGAYAAGTFVLGASWGGWDLLRWGSLPNLLGVVLMLACALALTGSSNRRSIALAGPLAAALVETHHLSALIFGVVWVGAWVAGRSVPGSSRRWLARGAGAGAVAAAIASPFLWRFGGLVIDRLASDRPSAGAEVAGLAFLNVGEPAIPPWQWVTELGPLLCALALLGVVTRMREPAVAAESPGRAAVDALVVGSAAALALAYLGLDWLARPIAQGVSGSDLAVLTPSRFLTDLAYPLAVLAGLGFARLVAWRREAAWAVLALGIAWSLREALPLRGPTVPIDQLAGLEFMREAAPADVLLLANPVWAPYVTGREGAMVVLRQEALTDYTARKRALLAEGSDGIRAWMREHRRPVWVRTTRELAGPDIALRFEQGEERLYSVVLEPGG